MLVVLVLIAAVVLALVLTAPKDEADNPDDTENATVELISKETSEIESIKIMTPEHEMVLLPFDNEGNTEFYIEGYEIDQTRTSLSSTVARSLYILYASKDLGEVDDLDKFGLGTPPEATVMLSYTDGSGDELKLGINPGESAGRYVLYDGKVYISAGVSENAFSSPLEFLDTTIINVEDLTSETEEGNEAPIADILKRVAITGADFPEEIVLREDNTNIMGYSMEKPMVADAASDKVANLIDALKIVTVDSIVKKNVEESELAEYGLDNPAAVVEYELNKDKHTIKVSARDTENMRYLIHDDDTTVYLISNDAVSAWAEAKPMSLRSSLIWLPNIQSVEKIEITNDGKTSTITVDREINESKTTEDSVNYDLFAKNEAGEDIDYDVYQPFYKQLISVSILSMDEAEYDQNAPYMSVTYTYFEDFDRVSDTVEFFTVGDKERLAVEVNGVFGGILKKSLIDDVLKIIEPTLKNTASE